MASNSNDKKPDTEDSDSAGNALSCATDDAAPERPPAGGPLVPTDDVSCPVDPVPDPDPTVFALLDDHRVHGALGLPGAPVGPHRTNPHASTIEFSLHMMEEACKGAQLRYSAHGVVKDYGPPVVYHPGILQKLNEQQYGAVLAALMASFTRTRAAGNHVSNWSMAVQAAHLNPLGHLYVSRNGRVEEIQELQICGAFSP